MTGAEMITAERKRHVDVEGWTSEHDDTHTRGEMAKAASAYLLAAEVQIEGLEPHSTFPPAFWPWGEQWWKPTEDPVGNLVKAGALIAAEIDRLKRAQESKSQTPVK